MVEINYKIVMTAIIGLTIIAVAQMIYDGDNSTLGMMAVGAICLMAGVMLPTPKVDNKTGVLRW